MLSAESASVLENLQQHRRNSQRIKNSLVQAASVHWDSTAPFSTDVRRRTRHSFHGNQIPQWSAATAASAAARRSFGKSTLRRIKKFEIVLDQRKKVRLLYLSIFMVVMVVKLLLLFINITTAE